ncbi:MAG: sulfurtransferase [Leifsonia sp.]|nr:sulfurtransferase [Leifsonia sp.]|tara:strand:+ start:69444 stop:69752 length:309 start_codon:yes stop_codon:yes gene_type:complete
MQSITPTDLAALGDTATIVDVRERDEYDAAHVPGVIHVALSELTSRFAELPDDRTLYVMCLSGGRSVQATNFLTAQGRDAVNVLGGITEWYHAGLPIERSAA